MQIKYTTGQADLRFNILAEGLAHRAWEEFAIIVSGITVTQKNNGTSAEMKVVGHRYGTVHSGRHEVTVGIYRITVEDHGINLSAPLGNAAKMLKAKYLTSQVMGMRW